MCHDTILVCLGAVDWLMGMQMLASSRNITTNVYSVLDRYLACKVVLRVQNGFHPDSRYIHFQPQTGLFPSGFDAPVLRLLTFLPSLFPNQTVDVDGC